MDGNHQRSIKTKIMPKIIIDHDEWYPVHIPDLYLPEHHTRRTKIYEVPDDFLPRWEKIITEFNAIQEELATLSNFK